MTAAFDLPPIRGLCRAALAEADTGRKAASVRAINVDVLATGSESSLT